jgi:hypothetical protein
LAGDAIPLRCGGEVIGTVALDRPSPDLFAGLLCPGPDFERYRPLFDRVFSLQRRVDEAPDAEYQDAWSQWHESLEVIERLGLSFGEEGIPIEDFEVDDNWRVSFRAALWWMATEGGDPPL